ncbi:hypothetical protein GCM10007423_26880 [Dyadobacter endophyticus]|uniref:Uncharacterized protein n=1 Tax=Dyadobacter endophyticus TaxID=1749036 RepID=A0ABQ1YQV6_9BACT|nr:hypothetical protein GCM10007423_26880 [Dyadobacter endophyticus]
MLIWLEIVFFATLTKAMELEFVFVHSSSWNSLRQLPLSILLKEMKFLNLKSELAGKSLTTPVTVVTNESLK